MHSGLAARTVEIEDPGDLLAIVPEVGGHVWLHQGDGLVGWGQAARIPVLAGVERFGQARRDLRRLFAEIRTDDELARPGTGPVALASFSFEPARAGSTLVVPEVAVGRRDGRSWVTVVAPAGDARLDDPAAAPREQPAPVAHERVRYAGSSLAEIHWLAAVARAVDRIAAHELEKVVLARDRLVWSRQAFDARLLAARLAARFPSCYTFAIEGLVGASPELLVRRRGAEVTSLVLAGSAARGHDEQADAALGQALLASAKDASEHTPAVASVREALVGQVTALDVDPEPWLLRLANVQHLATAVRGRTADETVDALSLAGALHPTAAVGGTPRHEALLAIRELEHLDRGRYAAPVGWTDARGDGELAIALRCAQLDGRSARLFAGAGVVAGSLPEAELEETRLKLRAMQSAFEG